MRKEILRKEAYARRDSVRDGKLFSESICGRLMALPEYRAAQRLAIYVGTAEEVLTLPVIKSAWESGKEVAVPCCMGGDLRLFWIRSTDELRPSSSSILSSSQVWRLTAGVAGWDTERATMTGCCGRCLQRSRWSRWHSSARFSLKSLVLFTLVPCTEQSVNGRQH